MGVVADNEDGEDTKEDEGENVEDHFEECQNRLLYY